MTTLYQHLLSKGFTTEDIEHAFETRNSLRTVSLSYFKEDKGDEPVVGVTYSGDYRFEEESGLQELSTRLHSDEEQSEFIYKTRSNNEHDAYVFIAEVFNARCFDLDTERRVRQAEHRYLSPHNLVPRQVWGMRVKEMRAELKKHGVSPLPTTRNDAEKAYVIHVLGQDWVEYENIGEFHDGGALVIMVGDAILREALDYLIENSVQHNTVEMGASNNPFSRGVLLYDKRDLLDKTHERIAAEQAYYDYHMSRADDAIKALRATGFLHAISPSHLKSVVHRPELGEGDYYFINYISRDHKQVFGWFTLDELYGVADGSITRQTITNDSE